MTHTLASVSPDPMLTICKPGHKIILPRTWGEWHFTRKRDLVFSSTGRPTKDIGYTIDLWGINDHKRLTDWLFHVGGKHYGDGIGFYDAMTHIFRSAGWMTEFSGKDLCLDYWQHSTNTRHPNQPSSGHN